MGRVAVNGSLVGVATPLAVGKRTKVPGCPPVTRDQENRAVSVRQRQRPAAGLGRARPGWGCFSYGWPRPTCASCISASEWRQWASRSLQVGGVQAFAGLSDLTSQFTDLDPAPYVLIRSSSLTTCSLLLFPFSATSLSASKILNLLKRDHIFSTVLCF